jgi:hypothetical protein
MAFELREGAEPERPVTPSKTARQERRDSLEVGFADLAAAQTCHGRFHSR